MSKVTKVYLVGLEKHIMCSSKEIYFPMYRSTESSFAIANFTKGTREIRMASHFHLCREILIGEYKDRYRNLKAKDYVDFLLLVRQAFNREAPDKVTKKIHAWREAILSGQRIINMFEERFDMPKTTVYEVDFSEDQQFVDMSKNNKGSKFFAEMMMLKAGKGWTRSIPMLHIFCSLLRLGRLRGVDKFDTIEKLIKGIRKNGLAMLNKLKENSENLHNDLTLLNKHSKELMLYLESRKNIHGRTSTKTYMEAPRNQGVLKLFKQTSEFAPKGLMDRFKKTLVANKK